MMILLLLLNFAFGALSNVDKANIPTTNQVLNPGFELNKSYWTASGGTFSIITIAPMMGGAYGTWDSDGADQTFCSSLVTVPSGLFNRNGEASIVTQVASGTPTHLFQARDHSGNVLASTTINYPGVADVSAKTSINFTYPSSGSVRVCLVSVAANEPSIFMDNVYQGAATNIGTGAIVTDWQSYTPDLVGFGTESSVEFQWRRVGSNAEIRGRWTAGTTTAVEPQCPLPSGLTSASTTYIPSIQNVGSGANTRTVDALHILIEPSKTYLTFGMSNAGLAGFTKVTNATSFPSSQSYSFFASVPIAGWAGTGTSYTTDQSDYGWTDFPSVAAGTLITATTSSPTYGTTASNKAMHRRVGGNMEINWVFRQTTVGTAGSGMYLFNLPPGVTIDTSKAAANTSATKEQADAIVGTIYIMHATDICVGPVSVYSTTQLKAACTYDGSDAHWNSGFMHFNTDEMYYGITASVPITGWQTTNRAPQLINSVLNTSSGVTRVEGANLNCDSGSTINSQLGSWVSSVGNVSSGACAITLITGTFSSTPYCQAIQTGVTDPSANISLTNTSATSITVDCENSSTGADCTAYDFNFSCIGAK